LFPGSPNDISFLKYVVSVTDSAITALWYLPAEIWTIFVEFIMEGGITV
jgi:hypothetical protein